MGSLTNPVAIANSALSRIGLSHVENFEDSLKGETCETLYEDAYRQVMSDHKWRFLLAKAQLGRHTSAPENEWIYSYVLPGDMFGGPMAVFNSTSDNALPITGFEINGEYLDSNEATIILQYKRELAIDKWPEYFAQAVIAELAWLLAMPLTRKKDLSDEMFARARGTPSEEGLGGLIGRAIQQDKMAGGPQRFVGVTTLIDARHGARPWGR